jgi:uncharacterized protein YndB with AHSA1/START domain
MITLEVRKTIRATPQRLFDAWTQPAMLREWWGPKGVQCIEAEIDLRVGGRYRIANRFPDDRVIWIASEFEPIEPPSILVYSWRVEPETTSERLRNRAFRQPGSSNGRCSSPSWGRVHAM